MVGEEGVTLRYSQPNTLFAHEPTRTGKPGQTGTARTSGKLSQRSTSPCFQLRLPEERHPVVTLTLTTSRDELHKFLTIKQKINAPRKPCHRSYHNHRPHAPLCEAREPPQSLLQMNVPHLHSVPFSFSPEGPRGLGHMKNDLPTLH